MDFRELVFEHMTREQFQYLVTILIGNIGLQIALARHVLSIQPDQRPRRTAAMFAVILTVISCAATGLLVTPLAALIVFMLNFLPILALFIQLGRKDTDAIHKGEDLTTSLARVDKLVNSILADFVHSYRNGLLQRNTQRISERIKPALEYFLHVLEERLELERDHGAQLSVVKFAENGCQLIASRSIAPEREAVMEKTFRVGDESTGGCVSIAAYAAVNRKAVCIPNLAESNDEAAKYWSPTYGGEPRRGSIICVPMIRRRSDSDVSEVIAVISVSCSESNAFVCNDPADRVASTVIRYIAEKIEMVLQIQELLEAPLQTQQKPWDVTEHQGGLLDQIALFTVVLGIFRWFGELFSNQFRR